MAIDWHGYEKKPNAKDLQIVILIFQTLTSAFEFLTLQIAFLIA